MPASGPSLIPHPAKLAAQAEAFALTPETVICYEGSEAEPAARLLAEMLRPATGFPLPVRPSESGHAHAIRFQISEGGSPASEAYSLTVDQSQAAVLAPNAAGLFHGAQTLRQLLPPEIFSRSRMDRDWIIPGVAIEDFPRCGWRGMHLDVSRHFVPKDDVLRLIDTLASLKFNRFHWHLTDDQGWRIEIKKFPKLTEVGAWRKESLIGHNSGPESEFVYDGIPHGGFYTQEEIREVVRYAMDRGITIVPEIDMPGHMQAAIAAYPELGTTGEPVAVRCHWGISSIVLAPEESTVQFCRDVLSEVLELFPGELIHIGGDEVLKTEWEASPRIRQLLIERGLKDMDEMQSWFIRQMEAFLSENGRRLIGWDEIRQGGLAGTATVMAWRGESEAVAAAKAGHPVVMASPHLYFDHYQAQPIEQEPLAIGGFTSLEHVHAFHPVPAGLTPTEQKNILGAQGQLWTEYMPTAKAMEYMAFPRTCALAEALWSAEPKEYADFLRRLPAELERLKSAGLNYRPPTG